MPLTYGDFGARRDSSSNFGVASVTRPCASSDCACIRNWRSCALSAHACLSAGVVSEYLLRMPATAAISTPTRIATMPKNNAGGMRLRHSGIARTLVSVWRTCFETGSRGARATAGAAAAATAVCDVPDTGRVLMPGPDASCACGNGTSTVGIAGAGRSRVTIVTSSSTGSAARVGRSPRKTARSAAARSRPRW